MHFYTLTIACRQIRCFLNCYFASAKLRPEKNSTLHPTLTPFKLYDFTFFKRTQYEQMQKYGPPILPEKKVICILFSILEIFSLFNLINHWINKNYDYI